MDKRSGAIVWLWQRTHALRGKILGLMAGDIIFSVSAVLFVLLCREMVDAVVGKNVHRAVQGAVFLLLVILLQFLLRMLLNSMEEYIRSKMIVLLRTYMMERILEKEFGAVTSVHSGEWMNQLFSDVQVIADGAATILPNLASMVTRLVCAVAVLVFLEPVFAAVFLIGGMFLILVSGIFKRKMKALHKEVQEKQGKVQSFLQEVMENFLIVKVFEGEPFVEKKTDDLQKDYFRSQMRRRTISISANAGFSLIFQLGYLFSLCWGVRGLFLGILSYGTLTAILQLISQIQAPISNLSGILPRIYSMLSSTERLMTIDCFEEEEKQEGAVLHHFEKLTARNVSFSYDRTEVLKDGNFQLIKGDMAVFTGLSGGGKSTLFLLLLGIYQPDGGEIRIFADGNAYLPGKYTRSLFAYVPQGNGLFSGSILENLLLAKKDASMEEVWKALEIACADDFVKELPQQLDTVLGERGAGLSEGQRQRIAIARAVLKDAEILLLDEATSALDKETEEQVLKNICSISKKTCILVTHRTAPLEFCNRRLILENGSIREEREETNKWREKQQNI